MLDVEDLEWLYHAEGNSNILVKNAKCHKVLRARKINLEGTESNNSEENGKIRNVFSVNDEENFIKNIVSPLFGSSLVYITDIQTIPCKSKNFLKELNRKIDSLRPIGRKHKVIDVNCSHVQLMPDLTFLSECPKSSCVSVELKPKWGLLPSSDKICEAHAIKQGICRFCMHQELKLSSGKIGEKSQYCPLDLFGNCTCRMRSALRALFQHPQNNICLHVNGENVTMTFFDKNKVDDLKIDSSCELIEILVSILTTDSFKADNNSEEILFKSTNNEAKTYQNCKGERSHINCKQMGNWGIFNILKSLQSVDDLGIEEIYKRYQFYLQNGNLQNIEVFMDFNSSLWTRTVCNILSEKNVSQSNDLDFVSFCRFLFSTTLKDCSIIITLACVNEDTTIDSMSKFFHVPNQCWYAYRIKLVDLEPRCIHNIPYYYDVDKKIISFYLNKING